jgi:hypothetical protein
MDPVLKSFLDVIRKSYQKCWVHISMQLLLCVMYLRLDAETWKYMIKWCLDACCTSFMLGDHGNMLGLIIGSGLLLIRIFHCMLF